MVIDLTEGTGAGTLLFQVNNFFPGKVYFPWVNTIAARTKQDSIVCAALFGAILLLRGVLAA